MLGPHDDLVVGVRAVVDDGWRVQFGVGAQDALLELGERGAGVDAQLVGEQPAGVGVDGECLGLPAAAVQRQHEQFAQPFAQRVGGGQRRQLGDHLGVVADLQVEFEAGLDEGEPPLVQAGALGVGVRAGEAGERFAVPQGQRGVEEFAGPAAVARGLGLLRLGGELLGVVVVEVERAVVRRADRVAAGLADQHVGVLAERLAQPGGVGAQGGERGVWRFVTPQCVDQLRGGGGASAAQQ